MTKSEAQRLRRQKEKWEKMAQPVDRFWKQFMREFNKFMDMIFEWYFFYKPHGKGDKALHIIMWFVATTTILKVLEII